MEEPKEFSHIEIIAVRNLDWLAQFEKRGFFLSPHIPLAECPSPQWLAEEKDVSTVHVSLKLWRKKGEKYAFIIHPKQKTLNSSR